MRPKLNVKPSVMKQAAQVTPGQKRKASGGSAVAAVKPLTANLEPFPKRTTICSLKAEASVQQGTIPSQSSDSLAGKSTTSVDDPPPVQHR